MVVLRAAPYTSCIQSIIHLAFICKETTHFPLAIRINPVQWLLLVHTQEEHQVARRYVHTQFSVVILVCPGESTPAFGTKTTRPAEHMLQRQVPKIFLIKSLAVIMSDAYPISIPWILAGWTLTMELKEPYTAHWFIAYTSLGVPSFNPECYCHLPGAVLRVWLGELFIYIYMLLGCCRKIDKVPCSVLTTR